MDQFLTFEELSVFLSRIPDSYYPAQVPVLLDRTQSPAMLRHLTVNNLAYRDFSKIEDEELVLLITTPKDKIPLLGQLPRNWVRFQKPDYLLKLPSL